MISGLNIKKPSDTPINSLILVRRETANGSLESCPQTQKADAQKEV